MASNINQIKKRLVIQIFKIMKNRRNFLQMATLSICGTPFISFPETFFNNSTDEMQVVKQPEECETFFVRENTPITFNISKATDNISSFSLLTEELIPGSIIPVHKHLNEDEYFFFVHGTKNTWHGLKNISNDKVVFPLDIYLPALKISFGR